MNNCPQCNTAVSEESKECPHCGIFFSKWKERDDNISSGNTSRYAALDKATSSGFNWTILVIVCLVIVGILYYLSQQAE
ncbi:MAG: zinc ribbon domain-containing protein [Elusimicrobiota bacterium]|jgi:uncharacterized membrane protein YvbJ